jgi:hypothetical protein
MPQQKTTCHLSPEQVEAIQAHVDARWDSLVSLEA